MQLKFRPAAGPENYGPEKRVQTYIFQKELTTPCNNPKCWKSVNFSSRKPGYSYHCGVGFRGRCGCSETVAFQAKEITSQIGVFKLKMVSDPARFGSDLYDVIGKKYVDARGDPRLTSRGPESSGAN
jgi:hypothetical protein